MLAEVRLPGWASGQRVLSVGGQTNRPVDDVGLVTESGGWVTIQAKKGMRLDSKAGSPLAEALRQLVEIDQVGVPDGASELLRPLDADRDLVLILSDDSAPLRVNAHMAPLTNRLRMLPATVPLADAAPNGDEEKALGLLKDHLGKAWNDRWGRAMTEADFRRLVGVLSVRALRIGDDAEDYLTVQVMLRDLAGEATTSLALWNALKLQGQRLAEERMHLDRDGLVRVLELQDIVLRPVARLRHDIGRLRTLTAANTKSLADTVTLTTPDGQVRLPRSVEPALLEVSGNLAVTGAPGSGKTVLLHRLATVLGPTHDVVLLSSADLRSSRCHTRAELGLTHDLDEVLTGWSADRPGLLLLDGIDQSRGSEAPDWLPQLATALSGTRWSLVTTVRAFDLKNSPAWHKMFAGAPVDARRSDPGLAGVRHLLVGDLTDSEMAGLRAASPAMAGLLDRAGPRLRALLTNPFNLDLAGQLLGDGTTDFAQIRSRSGLLEKYWHRRVGQGVTAADRTRTLKAIVHLMMAGGRQAVRLADLPAEATQQALESLCRDGALRETQRPGAADTSVGFWHPVLFDYAVAMLALGDTGLPESLADTLDVDPNLAVTVRPSLEYRLGFAWDVDQSRRGFWRLALRLARTEGGHPLAATEAARVAVLQADSDGDLTPLAKAIIGLPHDDAARQGTLEAGLLAFLFAASVERCPRREALACLNSLTCALARAARETDDIDLALLAAQLPVRAAAGQTGAGLAGGSFDWAAETIIDCIAVALKDLDDPRRANLADPCGRLLALGAAVDPLALADPIAAVIAEPALKAWGMTAVRHLTRILPAIADTAPATAVEIGLALWRHQETRSTPTAMLNSAIMALTSTFQQDLDSERHAVGTGFAQLMRTDPRAGTDLLLGILSLPDMYHLPVGDPWRQAPWIRQGVSLVSAGGFQILLTMTNVFASELEALADAPTRDIGDEADVLKEIITRLVQELHHGEVWRRLLAHTATAQTPRLARELLPVLTTPSLYAHHETWTAAAHAARRAASAVTAEERDRMMDAARGIVDAHTTATRPEYRTALEERALKIIEAIGSSATPAEASQPAPDGPAEPLLDLLPDLDDPSRSPFFSTWQAEEPAPGSVGQLASRLGEILQGSTHTDDAGDHSACLELIGLWDEVTPFLLQDRSDGADPVKVALRIAERLVSCPQIEPDGHMGLRMAVVVLSALPEATTKVTVEEEQQAKHSSWASALTAGWGETTATLAIGTASQMARSPRWRAAHGRLVADHLSPLLDDADPVFRFIATEALPGLHPAPEDLIPVLEARLATEQDRHVATLLMRMLAWFVHYDPIGIDQVIQRLAALPRWAVISASPDGDQIAGPVDEGGVAVGIIAGLAATYDTPYARGVLRAWFTSPGSHPERATTALHCLRDLLNPTDARQEPAQKRVLGLLEQGAVQIRAAIATAEASGSQQAHAVAGAIRFAAHLARTLYGVSGALEADHPVQTSVERGDPRTFARLVLPILDSLRSVHAPAVTLHIVQTIDHLAFADPKPALLIALEAVTDDEAYWRESAGVDAALKLVRHFAAEHRSLFLGDAESTAALRRLLESFVRLGWQQAIALAEELDELFG